MPNFIQPAGSTSTSVGKEIFSQLLNIPQASIGSLEIGSDLTNYAFAILPESKEIFNTTAITGIVSGVSVIGTTATVATNAGSFTVLAFPAALTTISVATIADLRKFEPWYTGQKIILERAVNNGALLNAYVVYDQNDAVNSDDGYSVFVTSRGKRWKVDISEGIDVRLGGLLQDGSNLGTAIQKIVDGQISKIIAANTSYLAACTQIKIPNRLTSTGYPSYKLDVPVKIPSFFSIEATGFIEIQYAIIDTPAFTINNQITGLTSSMTSYINMQGAKIFSCRGAKIRIIGPGANTSQEAGIDFGNLAAGDQIADVRDTILGDVHVRGFKYGLKVHAFDTYICAFENCDFVGNYYNLASPVVDKSNSGEKMIFRGCTLGNSISHNIYWNMVGWNITFDSCSIDYAGAAAIFLGNGARGNFFRFTNGSFIEGFSTWLVQQSNMSTTWSYAKNQFMFQNSHIVPAISSQQQYASRRKIIHAPFDNNSFIFRDTPIYWPKPPSNPEVSLLGYADDTIKYNPTVYDSPFTPYSDCLPTYSMSLNNGFFKFSGTSGADITTGTDVGTGYKVTVSAGKVTVKYGAVEADGLIPMTITSTDATGVFELSNANLFMLLSHYTEMNAALSFMMSSVTSGSVTFSLKMYLYGNRQLTSVYNATGPTVTTTADYELISSYSSDPFNVTDLLSVDGTPLTTNSYVGVQVSKRHVYGEVAKQILVRPAFVVTGFVGSINIKLPATWVSQGTGTCQIITK